MDHCSLASPRQIDRVRPVCLTVAKGLTALSERSRSSVSAGDAVSALPEMRRTRPFPARSTMPFACARLPALRARVGGRGFGDGKLDVQPLRDGDGERAAMHLLNGSPSTATRWPSSLPRSIWKALIEDVLMIRSRTWPPVSTLITSGSSRCGHWRETHHIERRLNPACSSCRAYPF